jgi:hypothetical protein
VEFELKRRFVTFRFHARTGCRPRWFILNGAVQSKGRCCDFHEQELGEAETITTIFVGGARDEPVSPEALLLLSSDDQFAFFGNGVVLHECAMSSFAEIFCAHHKLSPAQFEDEVIARAIHLHATLLWRVINLVHPEYFTADRQFIRALADIRSLRDFRVESSSFTHHPTNRGFLRRVLKIRVSSGRLRRLIARYLQTARESDADALASE